MPNPIPAPRQRVLVTGAGTGIGQGVAAAFGRRGADVALHYSHSATGAQATVAELRKLGVRAQAFGADFTDLPQVLGLARQAAEFLGGIDVLVNNAGITTNLPFDEVKPEQFDTLFNVNIRAMFFLTQAVTRGMIARGTGGAVINLSSVHAFHAMTEHTIYAATKGAIVAFTRVLGVELAPKGVRVNCIAPGWITVENHFKAEPDMDLTAASELIPAGFVGVPDDVGELAVFMASPAARYLIGQTIVLDGGQMSIMANTGDFKKRRTGKYGKGYVPGV